MVHGHILRNDQNSVAVKIFKHEFRTASSRSWKYPAERRVASSHRKPAALIVDDDVGLIFWVGEIFWKAGSNIVPALNCMDRLSR